MKRTHLVAAVASAPLVLIAAAQAGAQVQITTATNTPVATATANKGAPSDIVITTTGSIGLKAPGTAVTVNSSNTVSNAGTIGFTDVDNAVGIQAQGGNSGSVTNTGGITVTETYVATDSNNDGLLDGPFAKGTNRTGIEVTGTVPFLGGVTSTGVITVHGNNSQGISIQGPMTGNLTMLTVTPPTTTGGTPTVASGSITVLGDNTIGLQVTPTGSVGGNLKITTITATGVGAQGVAVGGAVGGGIDISGAVTATGYRSTSRSQSPTLAAMYAKDELQQGDAAVSIAGNVAKGLLISAPPLALSTTNPDLDGNGVPDAQQGTGALSSFGAAPALRIGAVGSTVLLGQVAPSGANGYGLVIQGYVSGSGVFDQLTTPNLPAPVAATAIQVGVAGGGQAFVAGGVHNTGAVAAQAYQADATAIHFESGGATPTILNDAVITASSIQVNNAMSGVIPVNVDAILIDKGASVPSIVNNAGLTANITGTGGVGGTAGGIIDKSGSVTNILNTGSISAQLTQTLSSAPMPGTLTAIDISAGTAPQTISQSVSPNLPASTVYDPTKAYVAGNIVNSLGRVYVATTAVSVAADPADFPSLWRQVGATTPTIIGSVYFGSGGSTLTVSAGAVSGSVIQLGTGVNTLTVNGAAGSGVLGATVSGSVQEGPAQGGGAGTLTLNVDNGTLSDTNPNTIKISGVNVGAHGLLEVSVDPTAGTHTKFLTTGASVFAPGAQIGLTLRSIQTANQQTYAIVETVPGQGTLTVGPFGATALNDTPYLYTANASFLPAANPAVDPSQILLTVARKTPAQLGFNAAEGSGLDAVLAAAPSDAGIQSALLNQTTEVGLKLVYDQLLPVQGQGLFDSLDAAAQEVGGFTSTTPDAGTRVAGSSLWLQEVNERVDRSRRDTLGSTTKLLGIVGGVERAAPAGGALGLTLAYYNANEIQSATAVGSGVVASFLETGAYYRRAAGPLTVAARGAAGFGWFSGERNFLASGASNTAYSNWTGFYFDGHITVAYERRFGRFYGRPELSADYLRLHEGAHAESGGGPGFDLDLASRTSTRFSGQAIMVLGTQWGTAAWLRTEVRGGFREIFAGQVGDTEANFAGGNPFFLAPEQGNGGWATVGFSIKGGSQFSYLALEGDADFRSGEERYDLRLAGRAMF